MAFPTEDKNVPNEQDEHGQRPGTLSKDPCATNHTEQSCTELLPTEKESAVIQSIPKSSVDRTGDSVNAVSEDDTKYVTGARLGAMSFALTTVAFLLFLDASIIATAIPYITNDFDSLADIGWYGTAYVLTQCVVQLPFGSVYQSCNSKRAFMFAFILFESGSLLCGLAQSSDMLIVGRAVAGSGAGGALCGGLTIVAVAVPVAKRPKILGLLFGISTLGLPLGPIVGGALTERVSWRWCFYINLPVGGLVFLILLSLHIPDASSKTISKLSPWKFLTSLDWLGFSLFSSTLVMLLMAIDLGSRRQWASPTVIGLFCGSGVCFFGPFLVWEHYLGPRAMLPLSFLRNRILCSAMITNFLVQGVLLLSSFYLPIWFQTVQDLRPIMSGVNTLPGVLSQVLAVIITGALISKTGYYMPFILVGSILMALYAGLMSTFTPQTRLITWIGYQVVGGVGRGMALSVPATAIQSNLPSEKIPMGSALITLGLNLGASLFLSLGQTAFQVTLSARLKQIDIGSTSEEIVQAGATAFRNFVSANDIPKVTAAYNDAITVTFLLAAGGSAACFFSALGLGWKNVKDKTKKSSSDKP